MKYKYLAFDLDGTLYPDYQIYIKAWKVLFDNIKFFSAFWEVRKSLRSLNKDFFITNSLISKKPENLADFRNLQAELLSKRLGLNVEDSKRKIEKVIYNSLAGIFKNVKVFNNIVAVLNELSNRSYTLALLSDLPVETKIKNLGLDKYFKISISSEESGFLKPDPRPFELLVKKLNCKKEELLYIGNSPSMDLQGAKNAGIDCALINKKNLDGAVFTFKKWKDFVKHLDQVENL